MLGGRTGRPAGGIICQLRIKKSTLNAPGLTGSPGGRRSARLASPRGGLEAPGHARVDADAGKVDVGAVDDMDVVGPQVFHRPADAVVDRLDVDPDGRAGRDVEAGDGVPADLVLGLALVGGEQVVGGAAAHVGVDAGVVVGQVELQAGADGSGVELEV